jgi:ankyrin repeat protein
LILAATEKNAIASSLDAGSADVVKHLVAAGASVSFPNDNGRTPLHIAYQYRNVDMAIFLLDAGEGVEGADKYGKTPRTLARKGGHTAMAELLVAARASVTLLRAVWPPFLAKCLIKRG